jgi:hypothetical protein
MVNLNTSMASTSFTVQLGRNEVENEDAYMRYWDHLLVHGVTVYETMNYKMSVQQDNLVVVVLMSEGAVVDPEKVGMFEKSTEARLVYVLFVKGLHL